MQKFPEEFADLLTPRGLRALSGKEPRSPLCGKRAQFAALPGVIARQKARACIKILDERLRSLLGVERRLIPAESITGMTKNYSEVLPKTMRVKTAFFQRKNARSYQVAEEVGLLPMMRSESFTGFAEAVTGLKLDRDLNCQIICYEHGDYVGPHNDHHPESEAIKDGFVDFHVMFSNDAVAHQWLVYEEKGHLSKIVDINIQGGVSVYRLPFWHYTTPLAARPGREREARRWLLLGSFFILKR